MENRWYRGNAVKAVLVVLTYVALILSVVCGVFLVYKVARGTAPADFLKKQKYEETEGFAGEISEISRQLLSGISAQNTKEKLEDKKTIVDISSTYDDGFVYGNKTGIAYASADLIKWVEGRNYERGYYNSNGIVVCMKQDGTYYYYSWDDFYSKVANDGFSYTWDDSFSYTSVEEDAGQMGSNSEEMSNIPAADEDEANDRVQAQLKSDFLEQMENGYLASTENDVVQTITDKKLKQVYTRVWNYDGYYVDEKYAPVDAAGIMEIANENPKWNGRLQEAYEELDALLNQVNDVDNSAAYVDQFSEGNTNLTYLFVNPEDKRVYTNRAEMADYKDWEKNLKKISGTDCYAIIRPTLEACETTMNTDIRNWAHLVDACCVDFGLNQYEYAYGISVDTEYPIVDTLASNNRNYREYAAYMPLAVYGLIGGLALLLLCLTWLTVIAGRRRTGNEVCLVSFDRMPTEIAAIGVFVVLIAIVSICVCALDTGVVGDDLGWELFLIGFGAFLCGMVGLGGYLSLVRRIKAKTMWKNSVLRTLLGWMRKLWRKAVTGIGVLWSSIKESVEESARNRSSVSKVIMIYTGFVILQILLMALFIASGGGTGFIFFLLLLGGDTYVLMHIIRRANGRQAIIEGLRLITEGQLDYKIPLDKLEGEQKMVAEYINHIGEGLDAAVDKSLKDERLKTELITNVSHDIKTPLTSIINYIDLLKRENFTDPTVQGYLDVLEQKAQRLKSLTEDVVEASKVSTGNITLEMADLDFCQMIQQVCGEFQERFDEHNLMLLTNLPTEPVVVHADGRRMYRVLENICNNVYKYAMPGTRIYVDLLEQEGKAVFSMKNISAQPLNITPDELTERFIRGDVSRTTEGSGLGLSIARSLTELQGGNFQIYLDGDLFKVVITI